MAAILDKTRHFSFKMHKNKYKRVFEVTDYDSEVKNKKWRIQYGGQF